MPPTPYAMAERSTDPVAAAAAPESEAAAATAVVKKGAPRGHSRPCCSSLSSSPSICCSPCGVAGCGSPRGSHPPTSLHSLRRKEKAIGSRGASTCSAGGTADSRQPREQCRAQRRHCCGKAWLDARGGPCAGPVSMSGFREEAAAEKKKKKNGLAGGCPRGARWWTRLCFSPSSWHSTPACRSFPATTTLK